MKLPQIQILLLSLSLPLVLTAVGCSRSATTERSVKTRDSIQLGVAITKDVPIQIQSSGTVTPFATVAVKSQVDGELVDGLFNEGDEVKRGETILIIESPLLESAVRQAEANLERDEALLASAEVEAHRHEVLFKEGIMSAELAAETRASADACQATVAADRAALDNARRQLSFCRIASPIEGRVGRLLVDTGNWVRSGETILAVVVQTHPIYVDFLVPEEQLPAIQEHMRNCELDVNAKIPGNPDKPFTSTWLFLDNTADTESGTVGLRARFANDAETLWPDETVEVTLTLGTLANAVVVPSSAVQSGPCGKYLLVVRPDLIVERRPVTTGGWSGNKTIVTSGLRAGERLISGGQEYATPGKPIKIHPENSRSLARTQ